MKNKICLSCGAARVHRSRRRSAIERLLGLTGGAMSRCHHCNTRYVQFGGCVIRTQDLRRTFDKLAVVVMMAVAAAVVLGAILWFGRAQATPPADSGGSAAPGRSMVRANA